ncbi:hypothetical protein B0H21DRAFT_885697 [Amylocystis lapponica]|nr:hypothetical protein B0H21DRAFT_885697 [Amylocystis lapponica]
MGNERYISVLRRLFVWWWWWWSLHACTRTRSPHAHPHFPRISGGECGCLPSVALCRPSRLHCNEEAMFGAGVYPVPSITSRDYKTSVEDSEASDLSGVDPQCHAGRAIPRLSRVLSAVVIRVGIRFCTCEKAGNAEGKGHVFNNVLAQRAHDPGVRIGGMSECSRWRVFTSNGCAANEVKSTHGK